MLDVGDTVVATSRSISPGASALVTFEGEDGVTYLGPESMQSFSISYSENGDFAVGGTESVGISLVAVTDALPEHFVDKLMRVYIGYPPHDYIWRDAIGEWRDAVCPWSDTGYIVSHFIYGEAWQDGSMRWRYSRGTWEHARGTWADNTYMIYDWYPMGAFRTTDKLCATSGIFTTIQAYDDFYFMKEGHSVPAPAVDGTTEMNARGQMGALCEANGIELDVESVPDIAFKTVRPQGTLRNQISQLALATGRFARYENGVLGFREIQRTGLVIGMNDYENGAWARSAGEYVRIDHLRVELAQSHDSVVGPDGPEQRETETVAVLSPDSGTGAALSVSGRLYGGGAANVDSDMALWDAMEEDVSKTAGALGMPLEITGFSCTVHGIPFLRPLDELDIIGPDGKLTRVVALSVQVDYDGGVMTTIGATAATDAAEPVNAAPVETGGGDTAAKTRELSIAMTAYNAEKRTEDIAKQTSDLSKQTNDLSDKVASESAAREQLQKTCDEQQKQIEELSKRLAALESAGKDTA